MSRRLVTEIPALLALACDHSDAARLALASKLADIFLLGDVELSLYERQLVGELVQDLMKNNNPVVRQAIAQTFVHAQKAPREIAVVLTMQNIDVAKGVLLTSNSLTDDDLITVITHKSGEHARAIAQREDVSEAVADALVTTGDISVMKIVAENLGAKLSGKAMAAMTEAARLVRDLHRPVIVRPEMTPNLASKLYWWVEPDLRRIALQRFGFQSGQLDQSLVRAIDDKLNEHILQRYDDAAMQRVADWLEERGAIRAKLLPKLLRMGYFRLFNIVLARLAAIETDLADAIINATGGNLMAALCRSLEIDKAGFVSIFLLSRGARPDEHIVHPRELSEALAAFDRITKDDAHNLLQTWRQNPDALYDMAATAKAAKA